MANRIYSVAVVAPAAFPASNSPSITIPFAPASFVLVNEDPTRANYIEYSFDGTTVHGRLTPEALPAIQFTRQRGKLIWVRRGAGTPTIRITAEA